MMGRPLAMLALLAAASLSHSGETRDITTAQIIAQSASAALTCSRWQPVGVCFWLRCGFKCRVRSSLKVGHYNPDLVVSAYHEVGGNPWVEMRATLGAAAKAGGQALVRSLAGVDIGEGDRTEGTTSKDHKNLRFKEADAIGHPVASLLSITSFTGLICPSETRSFFPYFQSTLDLLAWRTEIPESLFPASFIPGLREIGRFPVNTWGGVYPRSGFIIQAEDPKAGAVAAQRAGDIVTRSGQPHVYVPTGSGGVRMIGGSRVWLPPPLLENNPRTGWWQMHTPVPAGKCEAFGGNDTASVASWADGKSDEKGDYAWTLWRPYECCRRRGQWFLFDIDFAPFP
jgi:integrating conjugative element protein (TIGR03756 family)